MRLLILLALQLNLVLSMSPNLDYNQIANIKKQIEKLQNSMPQITRLPTAIYTTTGSGYPKPPSGQIGFLAVKVPRPFPSALSPSFSPSSIQDPYGTQPPPNYPAAPYGRSDDGYPKSDAMQDPRSATSIPSKPSILSAGYPNQKSPSNVGRFTPTVPETPKTSGYYEVPTQYMGSEEMTVDGEESPEERKRKVVEQAQQILKQLMEENPGKKATIQIESDDPELNGKIVDHTGKIIASPDEDSTASPYPQNEIPPRSQGRPVDLSFSGPQLEQRPAVADEKPANSKGIPDPVSRSKYDSAPSLQPTDSNTRTKPKGNTPEDKREFPVRVVRPNSQTPEKRKTIDGKTESHEGTFTRTYYVIDGEEPPAPNVVWNPSSKEVSDICLGRHNEYRKRHYAVPLKYDQRINKIAQDYAVKLANDIATLGAKAGFKHSDCGLGENLYYKKATGPWHLTAEEIAKEAIDGWYIEVNDYKDFGEKNTWRSSPNKKVGHFTQLVWRHSLYMGMAVHRMRLPGGEGLYVAVANYDPPGNYQNMYDVNVLEDGMYDGPDYLPPPPKPIERVLSPKNKEDPYGYEEYVKAREVLQTKNSVDGDDGYNNYVGSPRLRQNKSNSDQQAGYKDNSIMSMSDLEKLLGM